MIFPEVGNGYEPHLPRLGPVVVRPGHNNRRRRLTDSEGDGEGFVLPFEGRTRIGPVGFVRILLAVMVVVMGAVVMVPDMGMKMEEAHPRCAVVVPVEGGVGSESNKDQCRNQHQRQPEPSHPPL